MMNNYILISLVTFIISAICEFFIILRILNFCKEKNLYDLPSARKIHKNAIPRLGGISFIPSMLIAFFIMITVFNSTSCNHNKIYISIWSYIFIIGLLLVYIIGIIDDIVGVGAKVKFMIQILASALLPLAGLWINNLYGFMGIHEIPFYIGMPLTVFVMVFICNAMNLIDGIDGLAACLAIIAFIGYFIFFASEGLWIYDILIAGIIGMLISYLYFNMFGKEENNRKIFMGDSGSLTLGFTIGFLFIKIAMSNPDIKPFSNECIMLAYSLIIVPVFDVGRVIIHRLRVHHSIFKADKSHIHHKFLKLGISQHKALASIILLELLFVIINSITFSSIGITYLIITDIVLYAIFNIALTNVIKIKNKT